MAMIIGLAQINPCVGDLEGNRQKIISFVKMAKRKRLDLLVFPELALVGYPPEDLLLKPHFIDKNVRFLKSIGAQAKGIDIILGFVDKKNDAIYNSCVYFEDGKIKDIYHKIYLPNSGVFDEKRYFSPGDTISLYTFKKYKFSITICEDIWSKRYVNFLKKRGLDFIINISASPFHLGKISLREKILAHAARRTSSYVFYCNLVGGQDELVFDGTSKIISPQGKIIKLARRFEETLLTFTLNKKKRIYPSVKFRVRQDEEAFSALRLGLFDYVRKNGFKKVIVGVSGGIDSAVVVSLATIVLGRSNVFGLIMPAPYTSRETFSDAKKICENLGIKYCVVNLKDIFHSYLTALADFFREYKANKAEENLQARIRGNILMAFSNKFGYLVLNTGNKSEVSCGYCTLYGDMVGGFGVLKDVPKLLVYKLARFINKLTRKEIIPRSVIRRAPSAELKFHQRDTDALPPYRVLDPILKLYVEQDYPLDQIVKKGFRKDTVKRVIEMVDANEYKRRQGPVGIKITPRAFGKDRRMPITNKFQY
ncbi:MAG: NAD+ synthase [Candidatus Omnitrophota bacterium]|nr:MAG: NAD+ synthase [Candidatus Omnitrophota bacterium]